VRFDQRADPQQQILQGSPIAPGSTPGTDDRQRDPAEQVEMNVGQALHPVGIGGASRHDSQQQAPATPASMAALAAR
jgi:hypothetical protein